MADRKTPEPAPDAPPRPPDQRETRLAEALRANLRRRKANLGKGPDPQKP